MHYTPCHETIYKAREAANHPDGHTTEDLARLADAMRSANLSLWNSVSAISLAMIESKDNIDIWNEGTLYGIGEGLAVFSDLAMGISFTLDSLTNEMTRRRGGAK
ncbi:hypothetical protein HF670_07470 [Acidithiobacillus thiooxidans]|jgi:hypothetical protein|uniref:hypothetical protein n=1 Tax=Acidithiobacillus thiooxidans TaxID=930 RepID=UPI001C072D71|nr:hypothetical protein [Acidithiobacillus thiooxidans]MBU2839404.1 hypothetical protein [Acidithiobacillus thiooxidans]